MILDVATVESTTNVLTYVQSNMQEDAKMERGIMWEDDDDEDERLMRKRK